MEPYQQIFPGNREPSMTLALASKVGRIPKGNYTFIECYCTDPGCDCRRVMLLVVNDKSQQKAAISFGFDPDDEMAGPFLDGFQKPVPYADELLQAFVDGINGSPEWLTRMYQQYRDVRKKVEGKPYRGKAFVKPGKIKRSITQPPDVDAELERMLKALESSVRSAPGPKTKRLKNPDQPGLPSSLGSSGAAARVSMAALFDLYLLGLRQGMGFPILNELQDELRRILLADEQAVDELARVVAAPIPDEEHGGAVFHLLIDALEILRVELERSRPGSKLRMEGLQKALAQRVFIEQEDPEPWAMVTQALLESRIEILPVLNEANYRRMEAGAKEAGHSQFSDLSGDEIAAGLCRSIEEMGLPSPFEGMEAMLQFFAIGDPGMQITLCGAMFAVGSPFIRDIVVLMLFHPTADVRRGVAELLAGSDGRQMTPESLRRLIVSRNWFPEEIRTCLDQAIANARMARVECASLPAPATMKVHASVVDGAGAQSFQVIIPDGKGFASCSLLLKRGVGVADGFVVPLKNKRELNEFVAMMKREAGFLEVTPEHLDLRVSHALAEGAALGNAPIFWLVRIAELLGRDQWRSVPFDAQETLEKLYQVLREENPKLLSDREAAQSLDDSGDWPLVEHFAASWFEDDVTVDREIEKTLGKKKSPGHRAVVPHLIEAVLEKRRAQWLDRLVLTAQWLKASTKPPVSWHRMYHIAEAVADKRNPLKKIPLMQAIAELSYTAYLGRKENR